MNTRKLGRTRQAKTSRKPYLFRREQSPQTLVSLFSSDQAAQNYGESRGFQYAIGPFKTRFAAELMADYGQGNPHMVTVDDTEAIAAKYLSMAEDAIEEDAEVIYDVADNAGQIVANVRHMTWFKEAVARELLESN